MILLTSFLTLVAGFSQPVVQVSQTATAALISWEDAGGSFELEGSPAVGSAAAWQPVATPPSVQGARRSVIVPIAGQTRFFRLHSGTALTSVTEVSPAFAEEGVAVTRETILTFSTPLAPETGLGGSHLYAEFGGRRILGRVELSGARNTVTLFYQENLPASAQIQVVFDGDGIKDVNGRFIDPDGDGVAGGAFVTHFTTLGNTALDNTGVIGHVFAAEKGAGGLNVPLSGVTITVDGAEETLRAVTDAQGAFRIQPAPVGRFFVHIDGRTVTNLANGIRYPDKAYYPFVGKAWEASAGRSNNLAGGTGEIFLPLIQADALKPVSANSDTTIAVSASVTATNPAFAGVTITVPANSLFADNGTRGGKVGIAPVPADRLPGPLPPGLELPLVITVQTDGALNFDRPAPICFPNVPDPVLGVPLPAGSKQSLISFNHDKGEWEAVGTMTVSADGKLICSDPGSGIRQPGWHGCGPPSGGPPPQPPPQPPPPPPPPPDPPPDPPPPPPCGGTGGDPECACDTPTPDPVALKACYDAISKNVEEPCQKASHVTYNERVKICVLGFKQGSLTFDKYQECLKDAKESLQKDLLQCNRQANSLRRLCNKCNGAPKPPDERPLGVGLRAKAADPADVIMAKQTELSLLTDLVPPLSQSEFIQRVDSLLAEIDALAGGSTLNTLFQSAAQDQREGHLLPPTKSLVLGNAPPRPIKYAARILRPSGELIIRGNTLPYAQYTIFVPRDGFLVRVMFYDPVSKTYGEVEPDRRPESPYLLPRVFLQKPDPANYPDSDGDGLPDAVEMVYGSSPTNPDSDGDGLSDGVEVSQGTNLLDGLPAQIGVVASVKTLGNAVDLCAFGTFIAVAEGAAGVSIFNVADFSQPTRLVQIDTPGQAGAIASAGNYLAVADGAAGLAVIDISAPGSAFIRWQVTLPGTATSVTAGEGIAYVGLASGAVCAVDLTTGAILQNLAMGTGRVDDLLVDGNALFAYSRLELFGISLADGVMTLTGKKIAVPGVIGAGGTRYRVSGGRDLLYAVHSKGFGVIEWPDLAAAPKLAANYSTTQFGWKQIVANSGGIGVAAVGINSTADGPHDVYLHDLRPGGTNSVFLSVLPTPGYAAAVALQGRLAFVADGAAGLQVINYLPSDLAGVPPKISLAASFSLNPARAESGQLARVTANATDDILVSVVEFYVDGALARRDEAYPFVCDFFVPGLGAQKNSFSLRARAIDTAGNATWTDSISVTILADATPPQVKQIFPSEGGVVSALDRVVARFSEAMDPASLTLPNIHVLSAGPDLVLGTSDDFIVPTPAIYLADIAAAQFDFPGGLPNGQYRLELQNVRDLSGLPLAAPVTSTFFIAPGGPDGDPDGDGLSNAEEVGMSNPFLADTDGDGWVDELEVHGHTNPRDPASKPEWRVIAGPAVDLRLIDPAEVLPTFPGPILAQPQVEIALQPAEEMSSPGPWIARPAVEVNLTPSEEEASFGPWLANPSVEVSLFPRDEEAASGPWLARPLVDAWRGDILEAAPAGPHVARPPATVKLNP